MDKGDAPMSAGPCLLHQGLCAHHVVRKDRHPVVEHMVDGHHRHIAVDQLHHLRIVKVHTGDHHAVHTPVVAMLQIAHGSAADVVVDKGDIIAALFCFNLEAVHAGRYYPVQRRKEERGSPLPAEKVVSADGELLRATEKVQGHNQ